MADLVTDSQERRGSLPPPDQVLLAHVVRYRMTTLEALQRRVCPELHVDAIRSRVRRLRQAGYLQSAPLFANRDYYHLTPRAARNLTGESERIALPFGEQALVRAFGILCFCCLGDKPRDRFTGPEFAAAYPQLVARGLPSAYYYHDQEAGIDRIGFILVDHGADYKRLARKCRHVIQRRFQYEPWRKLIHDGRFVIAIVTAKEHKADRIHTAIAENEHLHIAQFRIETFPDLIHLI